MERLSYIPQKRLIIVLGVLMTFVIAVSISIVSVVFRFTEEGDVKYHVFFYNASQKILSVDDTTTSDSTSFGTLLTAPPPSVLHTNEASDKIKNSIVLDKFLIELDFYSVDAASNTIKGRLHITVPPAYRAKVGKPTNPTNSTNSTLYQRIPTSSIPNITIQAMIGSQLHVFPAKQLIEDFDVTLALNGDLSDYPYDIYSSMVYFSMFEVGANGTQTRLPLGIAVSGALQGFRIDANTTQFHEIDGADEIGFTFNIRRSQNTIGFSTFITVLMWCISLVVFTIALDTVLASASSTREPVPKEKLLKHPERTEVESRQIWQKAIREYRKVRQVASPLLAMPVALIFALPALRNSQPGIPVVGAYCDVVGFFWNVALVAISAVLISTVWLIRKDV
eukprot:TRINITY_DN8495_c0_g1_i1.p1 TRINITY_DN8495_c0_g1~~TRINITY_DN8495_c0_g1_i1.p1  ORF type:complete len:393 (+),score=52.76 TRINITY_DN8495_c0_g1_i1:90-1268(+)